LRRWLVLRFRRCRFGYFLPKTFRLCVIFASPVIAEINPFHSPELQHLLSPVLPFFVSSSPLASGRVNATFAHGRRKMQAEKNIDHR